MRLAILENIIYILKEFDGIIGAVVGSAVTLIITDILHRKGKLKLYIPECKLKTDFEQEFIDPPEYKVRGISLKYKLQIYNGSDVCKIMRDFKVFFCRDKEEIFSMIPRDEGTRRYSSHISFVDDMEVANIAPHEIITYEQSLYLFINDRNYEKLNDVNRIELRFVDEKDKTHKVILKAEQINLGKLREEDIKNYK